MNAEAASPISTTGAPAAFVRGVERRAVLLAELQCGDAARGDLAVAATLRAFSRTAADAPMAEWPLRFWSLLLATPDLRKPASDGRWPMPWSSLAELGNGPRAALLLRLVAGLEMDAAGAALGVGVDTYRYALQRAIPYRADGTPDRDAWQAWVETIRARMADMPGERLERLHAPPARQAVAPPPPAIATRPTRRARRIVLPLVGVALVVVGVGVAVQHFRPQWFDQIPGRGIRTRTLPPAEAPAATFDAQLAAWTHRDFFLIADAAGDARAAELPFFAWYAAQIAVRPAQEAATPAAAATIAVPAAALAEPAPVFVPPPRAQPLRAPPGVVLPATMSSVIGLVPAPLQDALRDQARVWAAWSPAQRADYAGRAAAWDALPHARRTQRRIHYAAWIRLDAVAFDAVESAVQTFARLPAEEQTRLRAEFDALDPVEQRGWLLGPAIGADYPKLQPLLAQLPEAQHAPMLRVLRRMTAGERGDLAVLAQRVPPQARADLVRTLLSTSDANRAAWLHARLDQ